MTKNHVQVIHSRIKLIKSDTDCKDPLPPTGKILIILGASARAAANSARQAGFLPVAADLFGDRDLKKIANWTAIQDYPQGGAEVIARLAEGYVLYTGGIENHPELVDQIAAVRPLLGNPGKVLRAVRDPFQLAACLRRYGFETPMVRSEPPPAAARGGWLRKPFRSCGGHGIELLPSGRSDSIPTRHPLDCFYQKLVRGVDFSAVFLAADGRAVLIGATRQLVGEPWTGAQRFAYCGSLWPTPLQRPVLAILSRLGNCLAAEFGLTGLFGVDFVVRGDQVFVLEVNPRYVASVEVLERASAVPLSVVQQHVDSCLSAFLPVAMPTREPFACGKAILFADRPIRIGERFEELAARLDLDQPWSPLADIPVEGSMIQPGQPILTLRAEAATLSAVGERLRQLAQEVRSALDACGEN
jgi:uncharacterized protein